MHNLSQQIFIPKFTHDNLWAWTQQDKGYALLAKTKADG